MVVELISVGTELLLGNIVNTNAQYLAEKVKEKYQINTIIMNQVGATIGAHSGPGTMALFFVGDER